LTSALMVARVTPRKRAASACVIKSETFIARYLLENKVSACLKTT
jgi:hypothetical protein